MPTKHPHPPFPGTKYLHKHRKLVLSLSLIFSLLTFVSGQYRSSKDIRISLLTYTPGQELYSLFGHSAIRVQDPDQRSDLVYNYGTFDFGEPNFYLKFIKGNLNYSLSVVSFRYVKQGVIQENRSLIESPLNLSGEEKNRIIAFLNYNALPENRNYLYDFQYDNCSSRILDLLEDQISDSLILSPEILPVATFRDLIDPYLKNRPWVHAGIDLLLGLRADRKAILTEPAFLPDMLHLFIKNMKLSRPGKLQNLAMADQVLVSNFVSGKRRLLTPGMIVWTLIILMSISALIDSHFRKLFLKLGNLILLITGILSLILLFLWIFPDHKIFTNNTDLLWAHPFLLLIFFLRKKPAGRFFRWLVIISMAFAALGILSTLIMERNTDLAALATLVFVQLFALYRHSDLFTLQKNEAEDVG